MKKVEIIIREMIDKCKELGYTPDELILTDKHYKRLINELELYEPKGMQVITGGIVYREANQPLLLDKFLDLPVRVGAETRLMWRERKIDWSKKPLPIDGRTWVGEED